MIIIVEGIDRVGKTTLVNMLHDVTGFPVYKNNTSFRLADMDNENETDKMIKMLQICQLTNANIIFDRFHWTDLVYGVIQRGYDYDIATKNKILIEDMLVEMGAMIILVKPTDVFESSKQHGKCLLRHDDLFNTLYDQSAMLKRSCNFQTLSSAKQWVISMLQLRGYHYVNQDF